MRQPIETAPRDGTFVILEDDASGTYDVAKWAADKGDWAGPNGEQVKIKPTHWQPFSEQDAAWWASYGSSPPEDYGPGGARAAQPRKRFSGLFSGRREAGGDETADAEAADVSPASAPRTWRRLAIGAVATALIGVALAALYTHRDLAWSRIETALKGISTPGPAPQAAEPLPADPALAELRQALLQARERAEALSRELAATRQEMAAQVSQAIERATLPLREALLQEREKAEALARELAEARRIAQTQAADAGKSADEAEQARQAAVRTVEELRQALLREREKAEALSRELDAARRTAETQMAASGKSAEAAEQARQAAERIAAELRQALLEKHKTAEALARELDAARRAAGTQTAAASSAADEAEEARQAAERIVRELRQALLEERRKAEALAQEIDAARRAAETQTAAASRFSDEAERVRQALAQERERAETLTRDLAAARRTINSQAATARQSDRRLAGLQEDIKAAAATYRQALAQEQERVRTLQAELATARQPPAQPGTAGGPAPGAREARSPAPAIPVQPAALPLARTSSAEAERLIARASDLLGQGNIGAARIVLERAVELGSVQAVFALAETHDPLVLTKWQTLGTQSDAARARELYARALAGGIQDAAARLEALQR